MVDLSSRPNMTKYRVTISEGVERITKTGVMRRVLLLPENVGSKSFEMGVLFLNPGQEWGYPDHQHSDEEGYFVLSGDGMQILGDIEFKLEKHMALYIPPNTIHITRNTGNEPLMVLYVRTPREYR